ncbi:MBL fold metallo-hydrolase [bacterium]|nr:MAG: MBL fold metallo-hydrolase [bacterium]
MLKTIHWLGHSGVKISGEKTITIDPYEINDTEKADIILITHDHYDHLSMKDIQKIRGEKTTFVAPSTSAGKLNGTVRAVNPGDRFVIEGIEIEVVPAYNIGKQFHPKGKNHCGYVFKMNQITYYHAGDTDAIPEMKQIQADVIFLPVGGTYTMTAEEAASVVQDIRPQIAVPIHWGNIIGSKKDAEKFKKLCGDCATILEPEN